MKTRLSSAHDVFFWFDPSDRPPLLFHHVPKTAGTSFRSAAVDAFARAGALRLSIENLRRRLRENKRRPNDIRPLIHRLVELGPLAGMMSHYTALVDDLPMPILALVREPEAQLWSWANFKATVHNRFTPEEIAARSSNMQIKSLTGAEDIPAERPEGDIAPYIELVDRAVARYRLFATAEFSKLLEYCGDTYGLRIEAGRREKDRGNQTKLNAGIARGLKAHLRNRDPVWLDRILYQRVTGA